MGYEISVTRYFDKPPFEEVRTDIPAVERDTLEIVGRHYKRT